MSDDGMGPASPAAEADACFRRLADAAPMLVWISGPDAMRVFFNRAWLAFRGRTMAQELGSGWTEGLHPDDHDLCVGTYLKAFSARQPFRVKYRLRRADGEYRWIEDTGLPNFSQDGAFQGFIGCGADITGQKGAAWAPDEAATRAVLLLTERERQVLVLIAGGHSTKETAVKLGISYKTADSHRSRVLEKLNVHETASVVRMAIRAGLIEP